jgi:hypothetical protein
LDPVNLNSKIVDVQLEANSCSPMILDMYSRCSDFLEVLGLCNEEVGIKLFRNGVGN